MILLQEFELFDPKLAAEVYVEVVKEDPGNSLFALGGALVGGWYGARLGKKPQIKPDIELAPL